MNNILDFADVIDCLHNTPKYSNNGFPIVRVEDIKNSFLDLNSCLKVDEKTCDFQNRKYIPKMGDIIITRVGSFGMLSYVNSNQKFCLGQNVAIISPKKYGKFIYYYLQSPYVQKIIHGNSGGSSYKSLSLDMIKKIPVNVLNKNYKKIGDMLYEIDSKIDINKKIIKNIESLLETIYYYWFVDFNFPKENGESYKNSGGELEWNEVLKMSVPRGWKTEKLCDVLMKKNDCINSKEAKNLFYTPIDCIDGHSISFYRTVDSSKANSSLIKYNHKDIIFGSMRPYFHRVSICPFEGVTRTTAFVLFPKLDNTLGYAYETMNSTRTIKYAVSTAKGTQQPYAVWEDVLEMLDIVKVPNELKIKYSNLSSPLIEKAIQCTNENKLLTELKNFVLPLLMNGQIKIED